MRVEGLRPGLNLGYPHFTAIRIDGVDIGGCTFSEGTTWCTSGENGPENDDGNQAAGTPCASVWEHAGRTFTNECADANLDEGDFGWCSTTPHFNREGWGPCLPCDGKSSSQPEPLALIL